MGRDVEGSRNEEKAGLGRRYTQFYRNTSKNKSLDLGVAETRERGMKRVV